jgi:hypothetical protein
MRDAPQPDRVAVVLGLRAFAEWFADDRESVNCLDRPGRRLAMAQNPKAVA